MRLRLFGDFEAQREAQRGTFAWLRILDPDAPPIRPTRFLLIASPSPVPPNRRVVVWSASVNFSNSLVCISGVMPMPESRTQTCIVSSVSLASRQ